MIFDPYKFIALAGENGQEPVSWEISKPLMKAFVEEMWVHPLQKETPGVQPALLGYPVKFHDSETKVTITLHTKPRL